jgi:hypothetical protein
MDRMKWLLILDRMNGGRKVHIGQELPPGRLKSAQAFLEQFYTSSDR